MIMYSLAAPGNAVHAALLRCVRGCFQEISILKRDTARSRKTKPLVCAQS
jgi:hypothetical protein